MKLVQSTNNLLPRALVQKLWLEMSSSLEVKQPQSSLNSCHHSYQRL